jgi:hypothetical protein
VAWAQRLHLPDRLRDSPPLHNEQPSGHERFYREGGEAGTSRSLPPARPPDMAKVTAAAEKYGIEILGLPPRLGEDRVL